ncbi:MAG TPA: glycosyltransferase family 39 protein [Casimicrobiaceae bacterium]|nr:glycosyltransferase family 39 protein [Casimicrobiaceae bacterium]
MNSKDDPAQTKRAAAWGPREEESERSTPWAALVAMMVLAIALRAIGLDGGLWLDEIVTLVESARHPLARILTVFPFNNQHTLYSVLAHVSIQAFGEEAWSLRLPALLFGAATPPVLYLFAREFTGRTEALLAGVLLAVSYHHVWFSQNARGYSALAFFALLASWLLLRGLRRGKGSDFLWYGVASALAVYTHLTMVFMVMAHAAACALLLGVPPFDKDALPRWRLPAMGFVLAAVFSLALYAPLLLDVQQFFLKPTVPADVTAPKGAAKALLSALHVGMGTALGTLVGAVLFLCGLVSYFRQSRFLLALFVLPGVITVAAIVALRQPIFPRFLFFLAGFGVLIVVRGALEVGAWLMRRWKPGAAPAPATAFGVALVALMVVASAASLAFGYRYPKQDFDGAMQFVLVRRAEAEPVLTAGGAIYPYQMYYRQPWAGVTSLAQLQKIRAQGQRVWVLYTLAEYMIEPATPDLMHALRDECAVAAVFRGTVAGGDITVCALPPASGVAASSAKR